MFLLESKDYFLLKNISSTLKQKKIFHTLNQNENFFFKIKVISNENNIEFKDNLKSQKIMTPTSIDLIIKAIWNLYYDYKIYIKDAIFFPLKQSLIYQNKQTNLGNIQFLMFSNLMLNKKEGTNKMALYKKIWPLDKEVQFNKLDTNLTNLKNHLKEKIDLSISFPTSSGLIHINID